MSQVTTGSWILDHNLHEGRSGGPAFVQHCYTVTPTVLPQHFSVASDMTMHQVEKGAWWSLTLKVCRSTLDQMGVITNITIYSRAKLQQRHPKICWNNLDISASTSSSRAEPLIWDFKVSQRCTATRRLQTCHWNLLKSVYIYITCTAALYS